MTFEISETALVIALDLALLLAVTVLVRLAVDKLGEGVASQSATGLLFGAAGVLSAGLIDEMLLGDVLALTLDARMALLVAAALIGGALAGVLTFVIIAGEVLWRAGLLSGAAGPITLSPDLPFVPDLAGFAVIAVVGIIADQVFRRRPPHPSMRAALIASVAAVIAAVGVWAAMQHSVNGVLPAGPEIGHVAVATAFNLIPGALIVTAIVLHELRRRARERSLVFSSVFLNDAPDGVIWFGSTGRLSYCNDLACQILGYTKDEMLRRNLRDLDHNAGDPQGPTQRLLGAEAAWPQTFDGKFIAKSGAIEALAISATRIVHDDELFICAIIRKAGKRRAAAAVETETVNGVGDDAPVVRRKRDRLTGLPDLVEFEQLLARNTLQAQRREIDNLTVAIIDMDDMDGFNERRGYQMGDALLGTYSRILRQKLRANDAAFRLEGDSFAVLMPGRGEGSFDYLMSRFDDILGSVQNAGFPEAEVTIGLAALTETRYDAGEAVSLAMERLQRDKQNYATRRLSRGGDMG